MTQVYNVPIPREFTNVGKPAAGFQLFFFETGTSTKKSIFSDKDLVTPLTNPVIADANGRFVQVFMEGTGDDYKAVLATDTDTDPPTSPIWTADPIEVDANDINAFATRPAQHWGTTINTADDFQISPKTPISAYSDDLLFSVQIHTNANASATLAAEDGNDLGNFLAALDIKKYDGAGGKVDNEANDLLGNQTYIFRIDDVDAVVLNPEIKETLIANSFIIPVNAELTIASGVITVTDSRHTVDTQSDASTDDLDTINGGTTGQTLTISPANGARDIVVKHGTGNIISTLGVDITLGNTNDRCILEYDGNNWIIIVDKVTLSNFVSKSTSGYIKIPDGSPDPIIIQWGNNTITANTSSNINLPLTFPNAFRSCVATNTSTSIDEDAVNCFNLSTSQIRVTNGQNTTNLLWIAIGN